jgi:hypothetical protein
VQHKQKQAAATRSAALYNEMQHSVTAAKTPATPPACKHKSHIGCIGSYSAPHGGRSVMVCHHVEHSRPPSVPSCTPLHRRGGRAQACERKLSLPAPHCRHPTKTQAPHPQAQARAVQKPSRDEKHRLKHAKPCNGFRGHRTCSGLVVTRAHPQHSARATL